MTQHYVPIQNRTTKYVQDASVRLAVQKGVPALELNQFARIGKGVISKSIGLQKNYKEVYEKGPEVLNECKSGCLNCPIYENKQTLLALGLTEPVELLNSHCKTCSTAVWENSYKCVNYVNEKNKYGYQPTLKCYSIKLLILYHFLQPDGNGFIKNANIKELAQTLGCTTATIHASNDALAEYGYCYISALYNNHFNVYLPEYKDYHKTAAEGGRGYITMSSDMLQDLIDIPALNTLRLNLKGILEVDNASYSRANEDTYSTVTTSFLKLRGFLPTYCKNNVIRKALEQDNSIFDLEFQDAGVSFRIHDKYAQKKMRDAMLEDTKSSIIDYVENLNELFEAADGASPFEKEQYKDILSTMHIEASDKYPSLSINLTDYADLASLALQYNLQMVLMAISHIYNKYVVTRKPIENFGALTRTIIRNSSYSKMAS